ncbi:MAG: proton-conducting transporter membrane subunit [Bryobacteraceae bacterium]
MGGEPLMHLPLAPDLLTAIVAAPGILFLALSACWLLGQEIRETIVARFTALVFGAMAAGMALLYLAIRTNGNYAVTVRLGDWFVSGDYRFPLVLFLDRLSFPLVTLTVILCGLVGSFSVRYLHRDRGFVRFFLLLYLFAFGSLVVFTAGSFDLLIGGWELVGISSVLLVAFFQERREPVRNALRVFGYYRVADLGLVFGVFVLHHALRSTSSSALFHGEWPAQTASLDASTATVLGLSLLFAAAGKSAQIPFCGWLPRAMEGPTPSSAIFYGAISVHMGAYLLLRSEPLLVTSSVAGGATVAVGLLTALVGTLSHRTATDAKTSLALASMTQVGIIFVEIGLGFSWLATAHMVGHATVRTMQFLRAPSMLHDYRRMHAASGGQLSETGKHLEEWLPAPVQLWLYRFGLERGSFDVIVDRFVSAPLVRLSRLLARFDPARDARRPIPAPRRIDA